MLPRFVLVGPSRSAGPAPPPQPLTPSTPATPRPRSPAPHGGVRLAPTGETRVSKAGGAEVPGDPQNRRADIPRPHGHHVPGRGQQEKGPLRTQGVQILGRPPDPGRQGLQDACLASLRLQPWESPGLPPCPQYHHGHHRHSREGIPGEKPSSLRGGSCSLACAFCGQ